MARMTVWAASALGAVGAGAGLAIVRRRRTAAPLPGPGGATLPPVTADVPAPYVPDDPPAPPDPADDAQAALDAARTRLRERAERLRQDIEASGDEPSGGG